MKLRITGGGDKPKSYFLDGKEVTKEEADAAFPDKEGIPLGHQPGAWRQRMLSLSCHPSQVAAIRERNKRHGITDIEYDNDGTCWALSRAGRQKLLALEGVHDKDGGYGDDHASNSSPLHREDEVPFIDMPIREHDYIFDEKGNVIREEVR